MTAGEVAKLQLYEDDIKAGKTSSGSKYYTDARNIAKKYGQTIPVRENNTLYQQRYFKPDSPNNKPGSSKGYKSQPRGGQINEKPVLQSLRTVAQSPTASQQTSARPVRQPLKKLSQPQRAVSQPQKAVYQPLSVAPQPQSVQSNKPATVRRSRYGNNGYLVRRGDSLSRIAKRVYGDMDREWLDYIAQKNNIRDINRISAGQDIALPTREEYQKYLRNKAKRAQADADEITNRYTEMIIANPSLLNGQEGYGIPMEAAAPDLNPRLNIPGFNEYAPANLGYGY